MVHFRLDDCTRTVHGAPDFTLADLGANIDIARQGLGLHLVIGQPSRAQYDFEATSASNG